MLETVFVSFPCFLSGLWSLNCPKRCIFCNSLLTSAKPKCVKAIYVYGFESFHYSLSENKLAYRKWATVYEILAIKILKKAVKILILDQIAVAVVVYFGQVLRLCRLINKSVLEWLLLNGTYYDQIYLF